MIDYLDELAHPEHVEQQQVLIASLAGELRHVGHKVPSEFPFLVSWLDFLYVRVHVANQTLHDLSDSGIFDSGIGLQAFFRDSIGFALHGCHRSSSTAGASDLRFSDERAGLKMKFPGQRIPANEYIRPAASRSRRKVQMYPALKQTVYGHFAADAVAGGAFEGEYAAPHPDGTWIRLVENRRQGFMLLDPSRNIMIDSNCRGTGPMVKTREKFATQVNSDILVAVRTLAEKEGRQIQALIDEALADLIEKHKKAAPRAHVMGAYLASHEKYAPLYKKLAE
jgi:hypothetical protein